MPQLDASQQRFCSAQSPDHRLLAPAGSGKTLSLLWRAKRLVESARQSDTSCRVCIFAFTRAARDELKIRLLNDPDFKNSRDQITVDTLNRYGLHYLQRLKQGLTQNTSQPQFYGLLKNNLRPIWEKNATVRDTIRSRLSQGRYHEVIRLFDSLKEAGFRHDANDLPAHFESHAEWLDENGLGRYFDVSLREQIHNLGFRSSKNRQVAGCDWPFVRFWRDATAHLWESAIITLTDQKYWTLLSVDERYCQPDARPMPEPNRYHHIMVDEFQDVSPLDLFLVRALATAHRSTLTLVGDDDQAIFEWRGATPEFILQPEKHFSRDFEDHVLETNYRSPVNIIDHSQQLIRQNRNRIDKSVTPNLRRQASIEVISCSSHNDGLDYVLDLARQANKRGEPRSLAIMGRNKSQILPIQILLTSEGVPYYAKEDLNVLLSDAFQDLQTILDVIATKEQRRSARDVTNGLLTCCNMVSRYPLRRAERDSLYGQVMKKQPRTFHDALAALQEYTGPLRGATDEATRYNYVLHIGAVLEASNVAEAIELIGTHFEGLQKHYAKAEEDIFYKEPPFSYLAEYAKRYSNKFFDFIDHVGAAIGEAREIGRSEGEHDADHDLEKPVHVMTALRAKGREFGTVVLLDVNDGVWPNRRAEGERELEQERRVFYVAVTRPRERLVLLPVTTILGEKSQPSRYIEEMGLALDRSTQEV